jgi:hypothetical protein
MSLREKTISGAKWSAMALAAGYDPQANGDDIVFTADLIDSVAE